MKKGVFTVCFLATLALTATPAFAHFCVVIPSDSIVMQGESKTVQLALSFSHTFEGVGMELVRPKIFAAEANGKPLDLLGTLRATQVMGHSAF